MSSSTTCSPTPATDPTCPTSRTGSSSCEGDICDPQAAEKALRGEGIDTIVHFAAESHNSLAVLNPGLFFRTNVLGTQTMLEAARQVGVTRFHHVSTCEVYGDLPLECDEAFTEDSPYRPRTPYNASKAGADHAVRAYAETYGLPITITNCCQQLRAVPVPREGDPALLRAGSRRPPAHALREHREPQGMAARVRPLHGDRRRACPWPRSVRRTTSVAESRPPSRRSPTGSSPRSASRSRSRRSCRTAPATTVATSSTPPSCGASSTGSPPSSGSRDWRTRCSGTPSIERGGSRWRPGPLSPKGLGEPGGN